VIPAVLLLLIAHYLITVQFNLSPLYLRLASFAIPLPFGMVAFLLSRIGVRARSTGGLIGFVSVSGMLTVIGIIDNVPIIPDVSGVAGRSNTGSALRSHFSPVTFSPCW
jgi:hypothetical protein